MSTKKCNNCNGRGIKNKEFCEICKGSGRVTDDSDWAGPGFGLGKPGF